MKRNKLPGKATKNNEPRKFARKSIDGKKATLYSIEKNTHLRTFVEYHGSGLKPVGAMLLNIGSAADPSYRVRFILKCSGSHDFQDRIQAEASMAGMIAMNCEIPHGESYRMYWQCNPCTIDRELELTETFHNTYKNPDYQSDHTSKMIVEEIKILREGHAKGRRKQQALFVAVTYTAKSQDLEKDDLEKLIDFFGSIPNKLFGKISGATKLLEEEALDRFLLKAFESGYQQWVTLLRDRLQMDFEPLDGEGVWQFCRSPTNRFFDRKMRIAAISQKEEYIPPSVPHLLRYDLTNAEITEFSSSTVHSTTLIHQENTSVPATARDYVFVDGKYTACLYLKSQPNSFDANGRRSLDQVQTQYLWDILSESFAYDIQVVLEASIVDQVAVALNNQDLIKQNNARVKDAEKKGRRDIRAEMHLEEAIEVQRSITSQSPTIDYSLTVYISRDTLAEMREDSDTLRRRFRTPAVMFQEVDTADSIWLQSLPYYGRSILVDNRDRRDRTDAACLASYMPLMLPQSPHDKGLEFIAIKGGTPINVDLFASENQGHMALWSKTGGGKSVKLSWFIMRALSQFIRTTIVDQPPSADASTFKILTGKLNGMYADIMADALNPFQLPNIPVNASQEQQDHLRKDSQGYLLRVLSAMVLGDIKDSSPHTKRIEGYLPVILTAFFDNQQIKLRYMRAKQGGIGSAAWSQHPILEDFVEFCEVSHIGLTDATLEGLETMAYIRDQLRKWTSGQYASVLNAPSDIDIDQVPLLTIAMRDIKGDEAAVFGSLIYLVAMRRAIAASAFPQGSFLCIDEAARMLPIKPICEAVAAAMVTGRKAGMRVLLASQEPGSVANSPNGEQIMDAITYHFIGRIGAESLKAYEKYLNLPYEIAVLNAGDNFAPDKETCSSTWLLKFSDRFTHVRAYLPPSLVYYTANNIGERIERDRQEEALAASSTT